MNRFAVFNLSFTTAVAIALAMLLRNRRELRVTLQVAVYIAALSYPWDFFAITLGAWTDTCRAHASSVFRSTT